MILFWMFFVFEGLWQKFFGTLEAWISFTNLWFVEVSRGFWSWFKWPLRSRKMIWIISLRMFFVFEVEVREVLGGFKAWFQQSFWTSQSWSPLKCLRKAFIYKSLGGGWVTCGGAWLVTHVIAWLVHLCHRLYVLDCICHHLHVLDCLCHRLHALMYNLVFAWHLANFYWFLSSDSKI